MRQLRALWNDERGFIISAELVLIGTLVVLGLVAGLTLVRDSVAGEFTDIAAAMRSLDQSYYYTGFRARKTYGCGGCKAWTAGSYFSQKGEKYDTDIFSFGACRETVPAAPAPVEVAPAPVVTPVCPPVAPPVIPCPAPEVQYLPSTSAPIVCPPAPVVCPPQPVCPTPIYHQ